MSDFGIFVCSTCAGIHREMNHKAKGIGMTNFTDKDVEVIMKNGNESTYKEIMGDYNARLYPEPDKKDIPKLKEFFKLKYTQKRFYRKEEEDEDSDDSDDKKKKKKKTSDKKTRKSKKVVTSEEEEAEEEEE